MSKLLCLALTTVCLTLLPAPVRAQPPAKKPVSFIGEIAPILKENCLGCHDARKRKGKLDMSSFESFRKGGGHEDPVVPGKPDESYILMVLTATDKSRMPPKEVGDPLSPKQIALLERWIREGANLDAGVARNADLLRELCARWQPPPPPERYAFPVAVTALTFTPDGKQVVAGGQHELTFWDAKSGVLTERISTRSERAYALLFLPDGTLAVAGGRPGQEGDVCIYDPKGGKATKIRGVERRDGVSDTGVKKLQILEADDVVLCLALSPDGKQLAAGDSADRLVNVWNIADLKKSTKPAQVVENHADWVFGVAFSPDSKHLLTASRDKTAKVWDLTTHESMVTFPDHQNTVYAVAVRPDGKTALSAGEDNQIRFWNAAGDGKQARNIGGHSQRIHRLVIHPTKPLFATCSADQTVRLWNLQNGQPVRTLTGHTDWVYALAFSPDGERLASGAYNGEVKIWQTADGKLLQSFKASPGWTAPPARTAAKK